MAQALYLWDWSCPQTFPLWEKWSGHGRGSTDDGYSGCHRAGIRSILVKPLVEHDSIKTQINRARERRVMKQMAEKYGPIVYKKRNLRMEELFCIGCGAPFRQKTKRGGYTPQSALEKAWKQAKSIANAVSVSVTTMKSQMCIWQMMISETPHEVGDSDALVVNVVDIFDLMDPLSLDYHVL